MPPRGSLIAAAIGVMTLLVVYRMGRERLLPVEKNIVSRAILGVYVPALRWVLAHKVTFLSLPLLLMLLGLMIWFGWGTLTAPIEAGLARVGVNVNQWKPWSWMRHTFPGLGREFMPPLDEGSFLYMPSLVPAGSLTRGAGVDGPAERGHARRCPRWRASWARWAGSSRPSTLRRSA